MQRLLLLVTVGFSLVIVNLAKAAQYNVSDRNLEMLQKLSGGIDEKLKDLERFYTPKLRQPEDQARFRDDLKKTRALLDGDKFSIDNWIQHVKKGGNDPLPQPPEFVKLKVESLWILGTNEITKDTSVATKAHATECENVWKPQLKAISGDYYDIFECGTPANVDPFANVSYYTYASRGTLTLRLPGNIRVVDVKATVTGDNQDITKSHTEAYKAWRNVCFKWMNGLKKEKGNRMLGATCGVPSNVSKFANVGYYLYQSNGVAYLAD